MTTPLIDYYYSLDQEGKTELDKQYEEWVTYLPCYISGSENVGKPHHIRLAGHCGTSKKPPDIFEMPITNDLHVEIHTQGVKTFEKKYGVDFIDIVTELNAQFCMEKGMDLWINIET